MKQKLLLLVFLVILLGMFTSVWGQTITIGSGASTSGNFPISGNWGYNYTQQIYTQAQINTTGSIQKIRFYKTSGTITNCGDWVVYMGLTTKTTFSSTTDWVPLASLTQVFNGVVTFPTGDAWYEITLTSPFAYDNVNNLVVAVDENTAGFGSYVTHYAFTSGSNTGIYYRSDSNNPNPATPPTASGRSATINQIQLVFPSTTPPSLAISPSPSDLATDVSKIPTLSWQSGGGEPTAYDVYFGSSNPPTTLVSNLQVGTTYAPGTLTYGQTYYWKIDPHNANGYASSQNTIPVWSFTVMDDPTIVDFPHTQTFDGTTYPPLGWVSEIGSGATGWQRSTGSSNPTATPYSGAGMLYYNSYSLNVPANATLISPPISASNSSNMYTASFWMYRDGSNYLTTLDKVEVYANSTPSLTGATLLGTVNRSYTQTPVEAAAGWYQYTYELGMGSRDIKYFLLKAVSAYGDNMNVDEITFASVEGGTPPNPAVSPNPTNNATGVVINTNLSWNSGGGAPTGYKVYMGTDPEALEVIANQPETTFDPAENLQFGKTYYWQVNPYNDSGNASDIVEIPLWQFSTATGIAITPSPANAATGQEASNRLLNWADVTGASGYKVKVGTSSGASDLVNMAEVAVSQYTHNADWPYSQPIFWTVYTLNGEQVVDGTEWTFTTAADPNIYNMSYTQSFDGVTAGNWPLGWRKVGTTGSAYTQTSSSNSSPNCVYIAYSATVGLPPVNLSSKVGTGIRMKLNARANYTTGDFLKIGYLTDPNDAASFQLIQSLTMSSLVYSQFTVNLGIPSNPMYYAIVAGPSYGMLLDDVILENLPAAVEPSALTVTNVTGSYVDLGWTENNTPPATQWDIIYGAPGFNPATEGQLISGVSENPYRLLGLAPSTTYNWYVRAVTTGKAISAWAGPGSFSTAQIPASLPLAETFETWPNGWTVLNGTQVNQWQVGTATFYSGAKSAYISNDSGATNYYNTGSTSVVHMYRDIAFTADSQKFDLSFWWKGYGENASYDYLQVFLVDTSVLPVAGTRLLTGQIGSNYNLQTIWNQANIVIPGTNSGATKRLVLSWWNDSSGGTQPPIAVDDINLTATPNPINPEFSLTPTSKSFGDQQIGTSSAAQVFTIKNTGGGTLNITSPITIVDDDAAHFILTDANSYPYAGLGPNATMTVSVVFHPTTLGAKSARLKIVDDLSSKGLVFMKQSADGVRSDRYAALTGNGYDSTVSSFPYTQDFEGTTFPPLGWVKTDLDGDGTNWVSSTAQNHTTSGTKSAYHIWSSSIPAPGQNGWLITPPIAVPVSGQYKISFWNYNAYPADHEYAGLLMNTTNNASDPGWAELWSPTTVAAAWSSQTVSLSTYAGQTIYLAFVYKGYNADGWYLDDVKIEEYFDYPAGEPVVVGTETITVTGGNANNSTGTIPDVPNASFVVAGSFNLTLIGAGPWTITIETDAPWGAYYQNGQWNSVQNVGGFITFVLTANKDIAVPIVLGDSDPTLPVELSSFTATITTDLCVKIAWIAQSETNHSGYNVLRGELNDLTTAIKINPTLIDNGTPLGTQLSYSYTDQEAYSNMVYYYWLESIALDGVSEFYGPLSVTIGDPSQDPLPPVIPMVTKLMNAFPNPFNPNTNLRYSLKEAGRVNISIYNVKGQLIKTYQNEHANPGYYQVSWDGKDQNGKPAASGIYMYRMVSGKYTDAKKMILAK